jgi:hypothetical protein
MQHKTRQSKRHSVAAPTNSMQYAAATTRRGRDHRKRAAKLTEEAQRVRDAADRQHLFDLAEGYARAADQMVPTSS